MWLAHVTGIAYLCDTGVPVAISEPVERTDEGPDNRPRAQCQSDALRFPIAAQRAVYLARWRLFSCPPVHSRRLRRQ